MTSQTIRLFAVSFCLLVACVSVNAASTRVDVYRSGAIARSFDSMVRPKNQAFCTANPDVLISFVETAVVTPSGINLRRGTSVNLAVTVAVDAVCSVGGAALSLSYAALPSSTAVAAVDYAPFAPLVVQLPNLAQFGSGSVSVSRGINLLTLPGQDVEKILNVGLTDGVVVSDPAGNAFIDRIFADGTALAVLSIGGLDLSQGGVTATVGGALGGTPDPLAAAAVAPLAENCSTATDPAILAQCAAIIALAQAGQNNALVQVLGAISGEELSAQITSSIDGGNQRGSQIDGRIAALRGGATGVSLDDVAFNYGGQQMPLGMMFNALAAAEEPPADEGFGGGLLDQRLGAFLNVTRIGGERDAGDFEVGFEFDGYSVLGGLDWRFSDTVIAGAALGWSELDSDLDDDGGGLDTQGVSLTAYGTWLISDRAYLDFAAAKLWNDYEQARVVDLTLLGQGFGRSTALGETDAGQTSFSIGGGWDVPFGEWVWSPRGSLLWSSTDIDGFTESGADINDLIFADQDFDSLLWTFSQSLSRSFSISSGAIQPYVSLDLSRETRNEAFSISPVLRVRPNQRSTPIFIDESDRNFGRGEVGMTFIGSRGFQWFASYSQLLGYDKVDAWAVRGGLRFEF